MGIYPVKAFWHCLRFKCSDSLQSFLWALVCLLPRSWTRHLPCQLPGLYRPARGSEEKCFEEDLVRVQCGSHRASAGAGGQRRRQAEGEARLRFHLAIFIGSEDVSTWPSLKVPFTDRWGNTGLARIGDCHQVNEESCRGRTKLRVSDRPGFN